MCIRDSYCGVKSALLWLSNVRFRFARSGAFQHQPRLALADKRGRENVILPLDAVHPSGRLMAGQGQGPVRVKKQCPLTAAGLHASRDEHTCTLRSRQNAECRTQSDLPCGCYALTPAEIALKWQTAPPRMTISPPRSGQGLACVRGHPGVNNQRELQRHSQEWRGGAAARRETARRCGGRGYPVGRAGG